MISLNAAYILVMRKYLDIRYNLDILLLPATYFTTILNPENMWGNKMLFFKFPINYIIIFSLFLARFSTLLVYR